MSRRYPVEVMFRGRVFVHRRTVERRQEYTPAGQDDLTTWTDMVTVTEHPAVRDGGGVAALANAVLGSYQRRGVAVIATDVVPPTAERAAAYFACVALRTETFTDVVFSRFALMGGQGRVVTHAHRVRGDDVAAAVTTWLDGNGAAVHEAIMAWEVPLGTG